MPRLPTFARPWATGSSLSVEAATVVSSDPDFPAGDARWPSPPALVESGQYTSIAFTERLTAAGAAPSVGTVGDALDNALAETDIGLFKTELIRPRGPWRGLDDVELAALEWVDWHNDRRLHTACHDLPPVEYGQVFYGQHPAQQAVGVSQP